MRKRLRKAHSKEELARLYAAPNQHHHWPEHVLRVNQTVAVCKWMPQANIVADLSCGDATIARSLDLDEDRLLLGDYAPGYPFQGDIRFTVEVIPMVDLFICTETLEHLDDPDAVLRLIRRKARSLVVSVPLGDLDPYNPEHYWAWDQEGCEEMLRAAGFEPVIYTESFLYASEGRDDLAFQIWGCQ